jgi:hypothetical protein
MSMIGEYRQLTPAQLDRLLRNPDNIEGFLEEFDADEDFEVVDDADDDDDDFEEEGGAAGDDDEEEEEEDEFGAPVAVGGNGVGEMGKYFSLDKAWHALQFMLNGHPSEGTGPLFDAILGGTEVGEDMGYGPSRVLTPDEVRAVAVALNKVDRTELKKKFDPKAFKKNDIYVGDWDFKELNARLKDLTTFFEEAAENGNAMLLTIS